MEHRALEWIDEAKSREEFEKRLRLKTFPLAVKLLEKEEDIPPAAKRPKRDLGYHLALCQGFLLAFRYRWSATFFLKRTFEILVSHLGFP